MTRTAANFLRVFAAWTLFVWLTFIRNITRDHTHSAGFKAVHITLAAISLAFAVATLVVVARARRSPALPVPPDPEPDRETSGSAAG